MFPLSDDNSDLRSTPIVTYVIIGLNVLVFALFQQFGANDQFTYAFSAVPAEIVTGKDLITEDRVFVDPTTGMQFRAPGLQKTPISVYVTLFTAMFMHGGVAHIFGNLWFLWIFGDNVEDRMGRLRYIIFYLLTGLAATFCHIATNPSSQTPMLGASGAISGVMGAYLALCPSRRVRVLLFRFITEIPGFMAVGLWFLFQLISGMGLLGGGDLESGVAYAAHIGGFVAGVILARPFVLGRDFTPPANERFRIMRIR
jgi:membrane associated rhomboid family serine protease